MKSEFSRQIFEKYSSTKFHENPSSGSRRTDMMRLTVAFRYTANTPKGTVYICKKGSTTRNAAWCSTNCCRKFQRYLRLAINGQGDVMSAHSRYIIAMPRILSPCLLHGAALCKQVIQKLHNNNNNKIIIVSSETLILLRALASLFVLFTLLLLFIVVLNFCCGF